METPRKFLPLRWLGVLATVAAWLVLAISIIALVWVLANVGANWASTLLVVLVLLWGVSTFLSFFVRGNVLLLLNDLERQSRANMQAIEEVKGLLKEARLATATESRVVTTTPAPRVLTPAANEVASAESSATTQEPSKPDGAEKSEPNTNNPARS